jgi:hypothetical protein
MKRHWLLHGRLLAGLVLAGFLPRLSPWARAQDIAWFRLNGLPQARAGLELDGSSEDETINGVKSTYDTLFVTPTIGLQTAGYIYHPNLLAFDFDGDFGWGWNRMTTTSPGFNQTVNESDTLNRYLFEMNVLEAKPYNASFFAAQDHTYRDYGSFDTFTVDSTRYGGRVNWNTDRFSINTDFGYRDETDTGLVGTSEVTETYFNFLGIDKRHSGQTTVTARWDRFDNILNFGNQLTTMNESVGVADAETFGSRQQITAATGATYSHSEYANQQVDTINANENVNVTHSKNLTSFLIFDFEENIQSPANETYLQGEYGIRHQLYESLTSTLNVHGSHQDSADANGSSANDLYGVGISENYLKRLQSWGHLSIGAGLVADQQDDSTSGGAATAIGEAHTLFLSTSPQYRPVYLSHPQVMPGTIQVTAGGLVLAAGIDYSIVSSGQLTEIRLLPSPTVLPLLQPDQSLAVSVTYQYAAANNASFESLTSDVEVRLDLFDRVGIYGRLNWLDNNAPPSVVTQTLTDLVGGVDYRWRWFRTGAEYEDYDSNFSRYSALRFFQNFDFQLNNRSTFSTDFNETFYHYAGSGDQTLYQFITRYSLQLWSSFSCYVQGGYALQDVLGSQQVNGSAQAGFNWSRGKLSVRAGYEYTDQSTAAGAFKEDLSKNRVFLYLKRTF